MCITISTWLPLLKGPSPAVVFSFRNPLDVAMSLMKGDAKNFPLARGLRLWIVYNMRAIKLGIILYVIFLIAVALYFTLCCKIEDCEIKFPTPSPRQAFGTVNMYLPFSSKHL